MAYQSVKLYAYKNGYLISTDDGNYISYTLEEVKTILSKVLVPIGSIPFESEKPSRPRKNN